MTYVYVLSVPGAVKIGIADDVYKRMEQLQTGSPTRIALDFAIQCEQRDDAIELERLLHIIFGDSRQTGEWFAVSVDSVRAVIGFAIRYGLTNASMVFPEKPKRPAVIGVPFGMPRPSFPKPNEPY